LIGIVGERVRGRHIWGANLGNWRGTSDRLAGRGHHVGGIDHSSILTSSSGRGRREVLSLVAATRVGIIVNARMASEFVGTAEALRTTGELAGMRLLAGVRPDMTSLMLQAVEGPVAERTFIGPG
jgi:hypothetical protein